MNNYEGDTGVLIVMSMAVSGHTLRTEELQHDVTQDTSEAQERAANDSTHRSAGVVVTGARGLGSAAGTRRGSRAGGMGSREGGRNNRGSGGDGSGGGAFLNLVINPSDERS